MVIDFVWWWWWRWLEMFAYRNPIVDGIESAIEKWQRDAKRTDQPIDSLIRRRTVSFVRRYSQHTHFSYIGYFGNVIFIVGRGHVVVQHKMERKRGEKSNLDNCVGWCIALYYAFPSVHDTKWSPAVRWLWRWKDFGLHGYWKVGSNLVGRTRSIKVFPLTHHHRQLHLAPFRKLLPVRNDSRCRQDKMEPITVLFDLDPMKGRRRYCIQYTYTVKWARAYV